MSNENMYLAVFLGSKTSPRRMAWEALPLDQRRAMEQRGIAAWKEWAEKHQPSITDISGPLGKTKKVSARGVEDISNALAAFTVVRAPSHEAAARMFENHPHFAVFPGDSIEIMPILPTPG
ncbi:MAG TPA: hypothetical protein VG501_05055 [Rhizomicrobium sp.]|nr:hypothetical protein [Rhizomicrobium sp.]